MQKWCPEEFAPPPAGGAAPAGAGTAGGAPFRAEFADLSGAALSLLLTPAERERVQALAQAEATASALAQVAEREGQRDEACRAFCGELAARLEAEWQAGMAALAKAGVDLALAVAERIVRREVAADAGALTRALESMLYRVPSGASLAVTAHPEDAAWLQAQPELCARLRVASIQADRRLARGGCLVACDRRQWDLTVNGQLEALGDAIEAALEAGTVPAEGDDGADHLALG